MDPGIDVNRSIGWIKAGAKRTDFDTMGSLSIKFIQENYPDLTLEAFARKEVIENPPYRFAISYTNHFAGGSAPTDIGFGSLEEERSQYMALANARLIYEKDDPAFGSPRNQDDSGPSNGLLEVLSVDLPQGGASRRYSDHPESRELVVAANSDDPVRALELAEKVIRKYPDWDLGYGWKGMIQERMGLGNEAVRTWTLGLDSCLRTASLCAKLSDHHFKEGDLREGAKWLLLCLRTQVRRSSFDTVRPFLTAAHVMLAWGETGFHQRLMDHSGRGDHGAIAFDEKGRQVAFDLADQLHAGGFRAGILDVLARILQPVTEADAAGKCTFCRKSEAKLDRIKYYYGYQASDGFLEARLGSPKNVLLGHGTIRLCRACRRARPVKRPKRPLGLWIFSMGLLILLGLSLYMLHAFDLDWLVMHSILVILAWLVGIGFIAVTLILLKPINKHRLVLEEFLEDIDKGEHMDLILKGITDDKKAFTALQKEYTPIFWTRGEYQLAFNRSGP